MDKQRILILCTALWLTGCALMHNKGKNPDDPYEEYNRHAYRFNDKLDKVILKPVATAYKKILPDRALKSSHNFFSNLTEVPTLINDILQLNFYQMTSDAWRFTINSTVGVLGLFDVASDLGLEKNPEDLGVTLGKWGYKKSAYFVIPFFGASTIRDAIAMPVNYQLFTIYPWIEPIAVRYSVLGVDYVDLRSQYLDFEDVRKAASLDPYEFDRTAYLQRRAYLISNQNPDTYAGNEKNEKAQTTDKPMKK